MEAHHNPYVTCPYNKAHEVPKLRIQRHLIKCRKQYPSSTLATCPFNATHIMPPRELEWHLRFCINRTLIEGHKYNLNCAHGELGNPSFHPDVPKENWDDDDDDDDDNNDYQRRFMKHQQNVSDQCNHNGSVNNTNGNDDLSNGALSVMENSFSIPQNLMGTGRGRLNYLVAKMNNNETL